jgi:O-antigen/teichoic acid export membrane protein
MNEFQRSSQISQFNIRTILKTGSTVFGLSALLLVCLPNLFLDLLGLDGNFEPLIWSMRMIGITLVALAGNMWMNSSQTEIRNLQRTAIVMAISATSLGIITLLIPTTLNWFSIAYAFVGFGFGSAYLCALLLKRF